MAVGAVGVVSVASNIIPKPMTELVSNFQEGRPTDSRRIHLRYFRLFKDLFIESNPIPIKTALHLMGMIEPEFRLPLCEMSAANREQLSRTLSALKLL